MKKILIVEDELKIARFLELELKHEGYVTETANDGRTGLEMALSGNHDLVILDIMLPQMNGIEVCRRVRNAKDVPIIMLTARDDTMDKVIGLDMGADDYMTKPFAIEELLARMRRVFRDHEEVPVEDENVLVCGDLKVDHSQHKVTFKDEEIQLTKKEYDLLVFMMTNKAIVLGREKILETVWGFDYYGDTNVVDVYIRYLRSKIDDKYDVKTIHTVRGVGYMFKYEI